jgi:hypothetical protein
MLHKFHAGAQAIREPFPRSGWRDDLSGKRDESARLLRWEFFALSGGKVPFWAASPF